MRNITLLSFALISLAPFPAWATNITVKAGDTISEIADREGVSIRALMNINGITDPRKVRAGQTLIIPSTGQLTNKAQNHIVKRGDTLEKISKQHGTSQDSIIDLNNLQNANYLYIGQNLKLPTKIRSSSQGEDNFHRVSSGETISSIALKYKVKEIDIIRINNISSSNQIFINQKLYIPNYNGQGKLSLKTKVKTNNNYHIVVPGDTLASIAKSNKMPLDELIKTNDIKDPNNLRIGFKLSLNKYDSRDFSIKKNTGKIRKVNSMKNKISSKESIKDADWRSYGPLKINWSNWQSMGGSYVTSSLNKNGQALYLAINCPAKKINATGSNGEWRSWVSPIDSFEHDLIKDLCNSKRS